MKTIRSLLLTAAVLVPTAAALPIVASAQVRPAQSQSQFAPAQLPAFTEPQNVPADLARLDAALNGTASFSGRFAQYGADGSYATGTIELQRPGKVRFEYDDPNPLLIISDGVTLAYHDRALDTTDRVPLSATPLNYFLKENIRLQDDTEVVALQKLPTEWRMSARDGSGNLDGTITMVFEPQTLALKQWIISDEFGGQTTVQLSDLRYNERVDPRRFILRDADRRDRRRR